MDLDPYGALESELRDATDVAVLRRAELMRRRERLAATMTELRQAMAAAQASLAELRRLRALLWRVSRDG